MRSLLTKFMFMGQASSHINIKK